MKKKGGNNANKKPQKTNDENKKDQRNSNKSNTKKKEARSNNAEGKAFNKKDSKTKKSEKGKNSAKLIPSIPPSQPQTTNDLNYERGKSISVLHVAEKPSIATVSCCCFFILNVHTVYDLICSDSIVSSVRRQ